MSICSDEINLLIQHYLQELGFNHSAFAFGCESRIPQNPISERPVQPGALVYLIQKGIMYSQMEAAADSALEEPSTQFSHQLNLLRSNLKQSSELVDELCSASRRTKIFPNESDEVQTYYLNSQSSLILEGHREKVLSMSWNETPNFLMTGAGDGSVLIWEFDEMGKEMKEKACIAKYFRNIITKDSCDITDVCWGKNNMIAFGDVFGNVYLLEDIKNMEMNVLELIRKSEDDMDPVVSLGFNKNGDVLMVSTSNGIVYNFRNNGELLNKFELNQKLMKAKWFDNQRILVIAENNLIQITEKEEPKVIYSSNGIITDLDVDPTENNYYIGDSLGFVVIFDKSGNKFFSSALHQGAVCSITCSNIPNTIATGGADGTVKEINYKNEQIITFEKHVSPVYDIAFDPIGRYIVSIAYDQLNILALDGNCLLASFEADSQIISAKWSSNGRFLSIGQTNGTVSIFDFEQIC